MTAVTKRQLWGIQSSHTTQHVHSCTPFALPAHGLIDYGSATVTLTSNVLFQPECTGTYTWSFDASDPSSVVGDRDPFYASTTPQIYAIAAATVISWMLVIMLVITPRTFLVSGLTGGSGLLGGRGLIAGASRSSTPIVGVGSRPWLQKVAALTVAISLTIATADTFKVAQKQYHVGFMDATALRDEVVGGKEIRIVRVISDIFLWLAQVQTLIRLFPRHKEKVLIKWIGFALIILDTIFSGLNSFQFDSTSRPRDFRNAVPALSYLFQLALELLYAAWVLFYVATKRRYAFYHSKMKNICIVAILSVVSILTPVVFFVTDISQPDVDGWGDYFRWVGATAASVLVWEWVERIEALEREEKRDGILGREIFDGDEMLDVTPSSEVTWPGRRNKRDDDDDGLGSKPKTHTMGFRGHGLANIAQRLAGTRFPFQSGPPEQSQPPPSDASNKPLAIPHHGNLSDIAPPDTVSSPVSRAENNSAASTVYTVQYHPVSSLSLATEQNTPRHRDDPRPNKRAQHEKHMTGGVVDPSSPAAAPAPTTRRAVNVRWQAITNQFKRRRDTPPPEVRQAMESNNPVPIEPQEANQPSSRWAVKSKLASLAATTTELWQDKTSSRQNDIELPVTVIPAQPKGRTWSPGSLPLDEIRSTSTRDGITNSAAARDHSVRGRDGSSSNHRQSPTDAGAAAYTGFPVIATHPAAEITVLGRPDEQNSNSNDPRAGQDR